MTTTSLKGLRLNKGLSQREAARRIGVARGTYESAERGDSSLHPATAKKIADYFDVKVTDIWAVEERVA